MQDLSEKIQVIGEGTDRKQMYEDGRDQGKFKSVGRRSPRLSFEENPQRRNYRKQSSEIGLTGTILDRRMEVVADESYNVIDEAMNNLNENDSSNFLATAKPFQFVTKMTGLWNPRKRGYAFLCAVFVSLDVLSLLAEILIPSICGPFVDRCVTKRDQPEAKGSNNSFTSTDPTMFEIYEITLAFDAWNAFSDTMTYILLIYSLWKVQEKLPSFSLVSAQSKVSPREWIFINVMMIVCSLSITIASVFRVSVVEHSKMKFYGVFGLGVLIVYLTAFTCCCVFAVVACALGSLVTTCFEEIRRMGEGNLNDVTAIHQKLYKQLSVASDSFKHWFIAHWLMFGANCLAVFAFDSMHFAFLSQNFSGAPTVFMAVAFILNFAIFLVPCVYASRVTWKCNDLLMMINNATREDWGEGHPFRERAITNDFIFYAERSQCGFRIGKMTFGSSGTWISVMLGLLGVGIRLFAYIKY